MKKQILVTVDTEALPARAEEDHVKRLVWGEHQNGTAGIREICQVVENFDGKVLAFLDVAGSYADMAGFREVGAYLERNGHCLEWHFHPEILGKKFWRAKGFRGETMRQDLFSKQDADIVLSEGLEQFKRITGRYPKSYRAGSFRWNQHTIEFLGGKGINYSFNASAETAIMDNFDTFCPESPKPFHWPNKVLEVPCGEVWLSGEIVHFRYPRPFNNELTPYLLADTIAEQSGGVVNILLHSWSFLSKDDKGQFYYESAEKLDRFRKILKKLRANGYDLVSDFDAVLSKDRGSVE